MGPTVQDLIEAANNQKKYITRQKDTINPYLNTSLPERLGIEWMGV
jgi:hypothetical protein